MRTAARRLHKKLGRRGTALAILGMSKICFGLGYALQPEPSPVGLRLLTQYAPIECWSWVWIGCGVVAFTCAWLRVGRDWLGFYAALIPPLLWGFNYAWAAVFEDYPRGFAIAAWYAIGHVGFILWAASVPEYSLPHSYPRKGRGR
jgi:hypothetical protein